jgi:DNA-binding Lrp family transcriptional regulator
MKTIRTGSLESMFPVASSKILDFLSTHKLWDYSVSDIAKYSGVSFKTALGEVKKLESQDVIKKHEP